MISSSSSSSIVGPTFCRSCRSSACQKFPLWTIPSTIVSVSLVHPLSNYCHGWTLFQRSDRKFANLRDFLLKSQFTNGSLSSGSRSFSHLLRLSLVASATVAISQNCVPLHFVPAQGLIRNTKPPLQPKQLFRNNLTVCSGLANSNQIFYQILKPSILLLVRTGQ